jgi:PIN domain nuclease of toxin-antitoxin system
VLVLDTHVWIWSAEGDRRVGRRAQGLIARAAAREAIGLSPASVFETAALYAAGRLRLARPIEQWIREALDAMRVRIALLSPAVATDAGLIPAAAVPDPMDRLIIATARQLDATLLTCDRRILEYARRTRDVGVRNASV